MSNFYIYIDSSVSNINGKVYGPSTVAWTIISNGKYPYRAGVMYSHLNGPNEIIYEGILSAISSIEARNLSKKIEKHEIIFYLDSESVIKQINGEWGVKEKIYKNLSLLKTKMLYYNNIDFKFKYKNEEDEEFKQVDSLSKEARKTLFPRIIKNLKQ